MSGGDGIDLFAPEEKEPGFPIHLIRVIRVAYDEPATRYGIEPTECEYTIEHGTCELRGDECIVEATVREMGLHSAIFGVWDDGSTNRVREADYRVRGWVSRTPATPNGPEEWDAGIEEVSDDEDD